MVILSINSIVNQEEDKKPGAKFEQEGIAQKEFNIDYDLSFQYQPVVGCPIIPEVKLVTASVSDRSAIPAHSVKDLKIAWFKKRGEQKKSPLGLMKSYTPVDDDVDINLYIHVYMKLVLQKTPSLQLKLRKVINPSMEDWMRLKESAMILVREGTSDFGVMTYNMLAPDLLHTKLHRIADSPDWMFNWVYRYNRLAKEIDRLEPTVVCLQEVNRHFFEIYLEKELVDRGYTVDTCMKRDMATGQDGCIMAYKKEMFSSSNTYSNLLHEARTTFGLGKNSRTPKNGKSMEFNLCTKPVVAQILQLIPKDGTPICVVNTHLSAFAEGRAARIFQIIRVTEHLKQNCLDQYPLVFCGDLNSEPTSEIYQFLENGKANLPSTVPCDFTSITHGQEMSHKLPKLLSAYDSPGVRPSFTFYSERRKSVLDYIFYSECHLRCTEVLEVWDVNAVDAVGGLPNPDNPSDHVPLMAKFSFVQTGLLN